jgi:hypothetical protein
MVSKSKRILLIGLGVMGLGILLSLVALPLWFPWVLRPLLPKYGVEFGSYERQGYGRLALLNQYDKRFKADRLETFPLPGFGIDTRRKKKPSPSSSS